MKVLVVGSGGREHALVWKLKHSPKVEKIYCAPGNAGIGNAAELVNIPVEAVEELCSFAKEKNIDLTIVGPEVPLVAGIVDVFHREGLKIFGPNKQCAQLEGSKAFAKDFMERHQIPTARYREYTDLREAKNALGIYGYPMVIKADGLAAGKGVVIAQDEKEAAEALEQMMAEKKFGTAGDKVVIEEFLQGIETSILCFVDGKSIVPMVSAQDYKRIYDEDQGPNTGGMGTYSPSYIYEEKLEAAVAERILAPVIRGLKADGLDFKGVLFIGLMITAEGPRVLEFNTRFGDPETQVILTRLETDLVDILESILEERLADQEIRWSDRKTVCVVIAAGGYPESYEKGRIIQGLMEQNEETVVFHAGTKRVGEDILTNGGRVLGVTAWGDTVEEARRKVYQRVEKISFENMQYRKDIGKLIR
ncbi:phosphoribosylamine--glycine ligase [Geosporobacter subterraneus DSM 17957]|uniref:Phosphoribosylamine--glycine ligase n=1 Tax=Geosporobacter subterraneus DSM 17957 TaxID=1121919 RepID=A0A1M6LA19_9FIRM|nr:phosphoribosylamine--glycine ligase [Geosporobacter subterraneus]SHJ67979.1 phosphoribosylamine--glycine ligase [Geosporobacter subterraneus DSM 17957]